MEVVDQFWIMLKLGTVSLAWIFVALWGVERLWPKDRPPERIQFASLRFWAFYIVAGAFIAASFRQFARTVDLEPLVLFRIEEYLPTWAAYVVGPLLTVIAYDFLNYWMHRAQHKWFWAQHSVHHSIRHLSAINSYMHWTEEFFRIAFIAIPSAVLLDIEVGGATLASTMIVAAQGNFIHSSSQLHFGKFGRLFLADNRWHRIHHSIEEKHFDKNFGTAVTFWDRLFGTAYFPESEEWPKTGVRDVPEITSVEDYLLAPFRRPRGYSQAGSVNPRPGQVVSNAAADTVA